MKRFQDDERGATAIEYGMIASLIFLVIIGAFTSFGNKTTGMMAMISDTISAAIGG